MSSDGIADQLGKALVTAQATPRQRRIAIAIGTTSLLFFIAAAPFVREPLAKMPAFIPAYQAALFFIDLITAILLIDQFLRVRSVGILVLAAGYLFDAFVIVPHTLSFPGAFAPAGLLGAREQTTAWLYVFWHGGFPLFVIAYALLRRNEQAAPAWTRPQARWMVALAVIGVAGSALALALLATRGHDWLPILMQGSDYSLMVGKGVSPAVWLLTLLAIVTLWQREMRVMDLWLMLVMWVWLFDIALSAILGSSRFDLGFYAGRVFGVIAAGFLLVALLVEMARMYAGALGALAQAAQKSASPTQGASRPGPPPPSLIESTDSFIHHKNIAHYRTLLQSGKLSDAEHRTIEQLLFEEERRDSGQAHA